MKIKTITEFNLLSENRLEWDVVAGSYPFHQWEWLSSWIRNQGQDLELMILVGVDDEDHWVGIAPFCIERGMLQNKLRFIGDGKACTDYMNLLVNDANFDSFADLVADWIANSPESEVCTGKIGSIELEGMASECPRTQILIDTFKAHGFGTHLSPIEGCWVTQLPDSWDEMHASFSKSLRRKTKKASKNLDSEQMECLSSKTHDLDTVWNSFVELHQLRRQELDQPGCFAEADFESFLKETVRSQFAEVSVLKYNGEDLAAMLIYNDGKTAYMYQSGFNPTFKSLDPGYLLIVHALRKSIANGFESFDFLRGDEPYKSRWKTERKGMQTVRLIPGSLKARLGYQIWKSAKQVKDYAGFTSFLTTE